MRTTSGLFVTVVILAVTTASSQTPSAPASKLLDGLPGVGFEWVPAKGISDRGSIVVPIVLAGATYKYQLDTGSDVTIIYSSELAGYLGWKKGRKTVRVPGFNLAGTALPATWAQVRGERQLYSGDAAGTIGLDILIGQVVVIDFPAKRLCVVPRADFPAKVWSRVAWTQAEIRNGKFFVHARLNGADINDLFFDSGASAFPLTVDLERWKLITGRIDGSDAPIQITTNSWGQQVTLAGAPAIGAIEFASVRFEHPKAFYIREKPADFRNQPYPVTGSVGNALFWSEIVVLDVSVSPQFGILR